MYAVDATVNLPLSGTTSSGWTLTLAFTPMGARKGIISCLEAEALPVLQARHSTQSLRCTIFNIDQP